MTILLRRAMAEDTAEVPDYFEGVPLNTTVRLAGWVLGLILAVAGIAVMVFAAGTAVEAVGAICAAGGAIALAAVVRCRRYETQIGRLWVNIGTGPFNNRIKRDLISGHQKRIATGWRRFYADDEFVLTLGIADHQHVVPTLEPDQLECALCNAEGTPPGFG